MLQRRPWVAAAYLQRAIDGHYHRLRRIAAFTPVALAVLSQDHRWPNLPFGEVVLPHCFESVQKSKNLIAVSQQSVHHSGGTQGSQPDSNARPLPLAQLAALGRPATRIRPIFFPAASSPPRPTTRRANPPTPRPIHPCAQSTTPPPASTSRQTHLYPTIQPSCTLPLHPQKRAAGKNPKPQKTPAKPHFSAISKTQTRAARHSAQNRHSKNKIHGIFFPVFSPKSSLHVSITPSANTFVRTPKARGPHL